ncbi:undecaprenyl-phosphate galactose phosphotransferase WbaP [Duganella sp. FT27W]|uniref:undecaprenyl-phosphate galactose phosphotransferase WbaP n=1 Tax=Duganella sp. FT27W TaxID=2654636 RepID=UPI00128D67BB|nr:undecaprenyl-phosphate galactose phosphotransferase WbaP [Duganella sp. FT27W]MPQ57133.1 undecaprenyl-phosphate galactose phosphotransferase WbaP [Duganella sp. FT27W]
MKPIDAFLLPSKAWHASKVAERNLLLGSDLLAMAMTTALTHVLMLLTGISAGDSVNGALVSLYLAPLALVIFWTQGHYSKRKPYAREVRELLHACVGLLLAQVALAFFSDWEMPRLLPLVQWTLAPILLLSLRAILKFTMLRHGSWSRPMVIVGTGANARETARVFEAERLMGYHLIAFLDLPGSAPTATQYHDRRGRSVPCLHLGSQTNIILKQLGSPHVVLALDQGGMESSQMLIQQLSRDCANLQIVPSLRGLPLHGMSINHFFAHDIMVLGMRNNLAQRGPQMLKRAFDVFCSTLLLAMTSPLFLWVAIQVKLGGGGGVFFGHMRIGQDGVPFPCYKFRTMAVNADVLLKELLANDPVAREEWERDFKLKNDPRVTKIGRFLRKTSLDELPQLWNVLKGQMSLVGPRPVIQAELERYGDQVGYYLEARPGITGLWQTSGRNDVSYETRVNLDAWYVKNWSLFTDLVILIRTFKVLLVKEGAY